MTVGYTSNNNLNNKTIIEVGRFRQAPTKQAQACAGTHGCGRAHSFPWLIVIIAFIVIIAVGAGLLLINKKRKPASAILSTTGATSLPAGQSNVSYNQYQQPTQMKTPDWYLDPRGRHQYRYWNGYAWTEHVADEGVQSIDPI
jgi:hypothetical protein